MVSSQADDNVSKRSARQVLTSRIISDDQLEWSDAKKTLKQARLWVHYIIYLFLGVSVASLSLFAPTIVEGLGYTELNAQLFTIPPYACAYVFTLAVALLSDRYSCRGPVIVACFAFGGIAFTVSGTMVSLLPRLPTHLRVSPPACVLSTALHLRYAMLVIASCSVFGCIPPLCAWVSDNVRNTTAASLASGLNIAFTGPGQIIGVWIYKNNQAPRYQLGHGVNAASLFLGAILSAGLWLRYRQLNRKLGAGEDKWIA
jgi:hypothetical protein